MKKKKPLPALGAGFSLIDTHCHLDMEVYEADLTETLLRAKNSGICAVITIGIDAKSSLNAIKLAQKHSMLHATVGVHPHDVGHLETSDFDTISSIIDQNRNFVVGYGEIGLDYVKCYAEPEIQKRLFRDQLQLAKNFNLPVVIHDREAHHDILDILLTMGPFDNGGIMHCFSGDIEYAKKILDLGFHISIPGIVTFKNATDLKMVAREIPSNRMLLETDGPFLAPDPFRGKRNEPLYILYTAEEVAKLRETSLEKIAEATTSNAIELFNLNCN